MTTIRSALAVAALAGVLAGCTVGGTGTGSPTTSPATRGTATATGSGTPSAVPTGSGDGAVGPDEVAVETTLREYQGALATGGYPIACSLYTAEARAQLVTAVQADGAPVQTCEDALITVFSQADVPATAAEAAATIAVLDVVVEGFSATITWTSNRQGVPRTDTATLQSVDGRWLLAGGP
jgi:hypothetical protein